MPRITLSAAEQRIKEDAPHLSRGDLRRTAKLYKRRLEAFTYMPSHEEALELVKAICYADTTGDTAVGFRKAA